MIGYDDELEGPADPAEVQRIFDGVLRDVVPRHRPDITKTNYN